MPFNCGIWFSDSDKPISEELRGRILERMIRCLDLTQGHVLGVRKGNDANELFLRTAKVEYACLIMDGQSYTRFETPSGYNRLWVSTNDLHDALSNPKRNLVSVMQWPSTAYEERTQGCGEAVRKRNVITLDQAFGFLLGQLSVAVTQQSAQDDIFCARTTLRKGGHEYACVCRATRDPRLLLEAKLTKIKEADAAALLELLAEQHGCEAPNVTWGKRGWAKPRRRRIHLPKSPDLSVGTVVHEFAHLVAPPTGGPRPFRHHGPTFVENLDRLLVISHPLWQRKKLNLDFFMETTALIYDEMVAQGRRRPIRALTRFKVC
jgi:hypothetical protein